MIDMVNSIKEDNGNEREKTLEACRPRIRGYLGGLTGDSHEAEEIAQDTLFRAYEKFSLLDDREKLMPWLYRMATNLFIDRYRKRTALRSPLHHTEHCPDGDPSKYRDQNAPQLQKLLECREH